MKLLFVSLCVLPTVIFGQSNFEVRDSRTQEPIPFVKVTPDTGAPFLSDLDGKFTVTGEIRQLTLSYSNYHDTTIVVASSDPIILMAMNVQEVQEMVVVPGENPAHRIMKQVIDNRKKNHPLANDAFTYKSYSKFRLDPNPELLASISDTTTDSSQMKARNFLSKQHIFLLENASKRTFVPPYRDKEEVIAYKVSGFTDPMFSSFANSLQSFSFYENQFDLLGKQYINPIARGGIRRYLFILEDTTIVHQDTTFTIFYRPRRGKNFEGLTGRLYINTNGFAIEKVTASPYNDSSEIQLNIVQEYEFIDGKKWFPVKLSTEIEMKNLTIVASDDVTGYIQGKGQSYIEDIQINPDIKFGFNDNVSLSVSANANDVKDAEWDSIRRYNLTDKERATYHIIDSISEEHHFERVLNVLKILGTGKVPLGKKIHLDLARLVNYNSYEGYRFGAGLETSQYWIKPVMLGGYFAHGTRDRDWKFGGYSTIHLYRKRGMKLQLAYQQDVIERGGQRYGRSRSFIGEELYRDFFIRQMEKQRLGKVVFAWDIKANVELKLIGSYQRVWFTNGYQYTSGTTSYANDADFAETGIEFIWRIRQKYVLLGEQKVPQGTKFPTVKLQVTRGWKDKFESDFDYLRLNAEIGHTNTVRGVGDFIWKLTTSKLVGDAPLFLAYNGNGTRMNWGLSVPNTFETMMAGGFYTTEQVALFTRFDFKAFATKAKWNEPQIGVHHAFGYGNFSNKQAHLLSFETMDKGYYEAGIILNGILATGYSSVGIGGFCNYGYYATPDWKKNIVPKLSLKIRFE